MDRLKDEISRVYSAVGKKTWQRIAVCFLIFILPVVLFVQLADEVGEQETLPFDKSILLSVNSIADPQLDAFIVATTDLGYIWWVGVATLIIVYVAVNHRAYRSAVIAAVSTLGSALTGVLLKLIFQRDRPELWQRLITENSYSFPSGHAMASATLASIVIVLLWPTKWRYVGIIGGLGYVLYIAFTRLYLGVHYPTDIIAGWLIAVAWVGITTFIIRNFRRTT